MAKTTWEVCRLHIRPTTHPLSLGHNTLYYLRVRHKSSAGYTSDWSDVRGFSTKSSFTPANEEKQFQSGNTQARYFGCAISASTDGSRIVVGAYAYNNSYNAQGIAFVFSRSENTWTQEANLNNASPTAAGEDFGFSVAINGTGAMILVGVPGRQKTYASQGVVISFERSGTTWTQKQEIVAPDPVGADWFGYCVGVSADGVYAVIGSPYRNTNEGAVYTIRYESSAWTSPVKLTGLSNGVNEYFGQSVAMSADGTRLVIGHPQKANPSSKSGRLVVYVRSGTAWNYEAVLSQTDYAASDFLGISVDINSDGSRIIGGAYGKLSNQGAAYIFTRSGSTWTQEAKLVASDPENNDYFGSSVSISGDGTLALVGSSNKNTGKGAAYAFTRTNTTWAFDAKLLASVQTTSLNYGNAVRLTTDGLRGFVGAYRSTDTSTERGLVYGYI